MSSYSIDLENIVQNYKIKFAQLKNLGHKKIKIAWEMRPWIVSFF